MDSIKTNFQTAKTELDNHLDATSMLFKLNLWIKILNKVINDNFVMLKKAKKGKIWNEKFWFQNLKKRSFCVFCVHFIVTELSEALQKKAISLLTGGAVDHLQTGNRSPKGRLFTWLQKNWRHTQELVQISYINSEKLYIIQTLSQEFGILVLSFNQ